MCQSGESCFESAFNRLIGMRVSELLEKYMSTRDLREVLVNELLYLQGLRDGIQLRCILDID